MPNMANICKLLSVFVALDMFSGTALAKSSEELREPPTFSTIADCAAHSRGLFGETTKVITSPRHPGAARRPGAGTQEQFGAIILAFIDTVSDQTYGVGASSRIPV